MVRGVRYSLYLSFFLPSFILGEKKASLNSQISSCHEKEIFEDHFNKQSNNKFHKKVDFS